MSLQISGTVMKSPVIVWLRQELRLKDHPALEAAGANGRPVILCFIRNTATDRSWLPGAASCWWLHQSLREISQKVQNAGGKIVLRSGNPAEEITKISIESGASAVYWTNAIEPSDRKDELLLRAELEKNAIGSEGFEGNLLFDPSEIKSQSGTPFRVFTPFWKNCLKTRVKMRTVQKSSMPVFSQNSLKSESLDSWNFFPKRPNWAREFNSVWQPGEDGGQAALSNFVGRATDYEQDRNYPAKDNTSRLSPYLHFGNISAAQAFSATDQQNLTNEGALSFQRELGWREFCAHLLIHFPQMPEKSFKPEFSEFPWIEDYNALAAWQKGCTGFPIVDAGMRQLWQTGWMHNRVRMVAASVLVKHLLVHWKHGQQWFWDTLVDADLASNSAGWQWVAGCGADAAPYFRVFNPVLQGQKFDPDGNYIKQWVPELMDLPKKYLHTPWLAPAEVLKNANLDIGKNYPAPLIEPDVGRKRALNALAQLKKL
ncbi:MAG: deoxyribodipyrimidine photo-lyase [Proteobacteria bacterium]|nr:deoxyribodipyrimidine photo-lyase [Pseudomonadota bacterium]